MSKEFYGEAPLYNAVGEGPGVRSGAGGEVVLIFGAGKSATCLIDYIIKEAAANNWLVTVADNDLALAQSKVGNHPHAKAISVNVENIAERNQFIQSATIVISLLPPALHFLVAQDCVQFGKTC